MAATVIIERLTGATPTATDITGSTTRLSTSDAPAPGTANPIPIPASGTNYSYWASTRLNCTVAPSGTIDNLRWYLDGTNSFGTGVTLTGQDATAYVQATGTEGTTGTELTTTAHTGLTAAPVDAFTFTSASPKAVPGSTTTTGAFGNQMVVQMAVGSTAAAGTTAAETATWAFDES